MKLALKKFKTLITAAIAAVLVFVLAHPSWLPLPETARQSLTVLSAISSETNRPSMSSLRRIAWDAPKSEWR